MRPIASVSLMHTLLLVASGVLLALVMIAACGYLWLGHHDLTARAQPSPIEKRLAELALRISVPTATKARTNPFSGNAVAAAAGEGLFFQHCAVCHGPDGTGGGEIASGEYPPPPDLRSHPVQSMQDGELFYIIQNGIRYTGMPAWRLPDDDIWRLVTYTRTLTAPAR